MNKLERILGVVGAAASVVAVIDTYVLKSKLAGELSIPEQVPTGLAAILLLVFSGLLLMATRSVPGRERLIGQLNAEKLALEAQVHGLQRAVEDLQAQLTHSQANISKRANLADKIFAVLVRGEASTDKITRELHLDPMNPDLLMGAIAELVKEGRVTGGTLSSNYRVMAKPGV